MHEKSFNLRAKDEISFLQQITHIPREIHINRSGRIVSGPSTPFVFADVFITNYNIIVNWNDKIFDWNSDYYTIPFCFSLFRHFWDITYRPFKLLCLTKDLWWGQVPEMRIWSILLIKSDLKLTCRHINRRHFCFNIKSISVHPLLSMNVMLDFICMVFAGMWTMFRLRKFQNDNVCLRRESNPRPLAF